MRKLLTTTIDKASVAGICADAISELERATRLHPEWPDRLDLDQRQGNKNALLNLVRCQNDAGPENGATGESILMEEVYEFLEAAAKPGNRAAARIELVQAMAMLLRIYCHLNDYIPQEAQP